jgi:hypothetical protein
MLLISSGVINHIFFCVNSKHIKYKMKIPKEYVLKKTQCKAQTDEKGFLSKLPPLASAISPQHYSLACVLNGLKPICSYTTNAYYFCPTKLIDNVKLQILASHMNVKTVLISKENSDSSGYICYINPKYKENAQLCAYITNMIFKETSPEKQTKMLSFIQAYNYILGFLYGYSKAEIRGYYLQRYLLKSLPPKIKTKMMNYVSNSNFDLDIVSYKTKLERLYTALKKVDNFSDFNTKYKCIIVTAPSIIDEIKASKKYKTFVKSHQPKPFKFDYKELKNTYQDEYKTYAPIFAKFEKSLTKK